MAAMKSRKFVEREVKKRLKKVNAKVKEELIRKGPAPENKLLPQPENK